MKKSTIIKIQKFRIKDSSSRKKLKKASSAANYSWNIINSTYRDTFLASKKRMSIFDLNNSLKGKCREIPLHSSTFQEMSRVFVTSITTANDLILEENELRKLNNEELLPLKNKLNWRTAKRGSLGWIPVRADGLSVDFKNHTVTYSHKDISTGKQVRDIFKFYNSKFKDEVVGIKGGTFTEDSLGRWFICLTVEVVVKSHQFPKRDLGIDLGVDVNLAQADKNTRKKHSRGNIYLKYQKQLAKAQRKGDERRVKRISAKIANIRSDYNHKMTTKIAKQYGVIFVGDLKPKKILSKSENVAERKAVNKSIYDAGIYQIKTFLQYKAGRLGGECTLVNEAYTTQTCSEPTCLQRTGPKGKKALKIKNWICSACGAKHDRDENAAENIRVFKGSLGRYTVKQAMLVSNCRAMSAGVGDSSTEESQPSQEASLGIPVL